MNTTPIIRISADTRASLTWSPRVEDCQSSVIVGVYRYWQDRKAGRKFPARADLDPLGMRTALGSVSLTEIHRQPLRFRLRLVGTNMTARLGFDPTGMWMDEIPVPEYARLLVERIRLILQRGEPLLVRNRQFMDNLWYDYETIWLPLAADGETIDMVMACQIFTDAPTER